MVFFEKLLANYPYLISVLLFSIGVYTIVRCSNLMKKVIGISIMESAIFLFFIAAGNIKGGEAPILDLAHPDLIYVNPLPAALILTGIVVSISVTAFALSLLEKLYRLYGTIDAREILKLRREVQ